MALTVLQSDWHSLKLANIGKYIFISYLSFFSTECSQLYYGTSCNYKCSQNCISGTCFAHNGSCDVGCKCSIVEDLQFRGNINSMLCHQWTKVIGLMFECLNVCLKI